jgi:hypothetical protein
MEGKTEMHACGPRALAVAVALLCASAPGVSLAHWCSNIWTSPSRILVKPEKNTVHLGSGPATLRVYVQNNFPYKLYGVRLRGNTSGYQVEIQPSSQDVYPGQNASFMFTITGSGGEVDVSTLDIQLNWRPGTFPYSWYDKDHSVITDSPSRSYTVSRSRYSGSQQEASLSASTLAQKFATARLSSSAPYFGRTGLEQIIHWFGYRFCYSSNGYWRCGSQDCPSPCAESSPWSSTEQFPQNCIRAGVEIAALHARGKLGSKLKSAQDAAINALKGGGSRMHQCMAAVVGGYLFKGAGNASAFTSALGSGANGVPGGCQSAGKRILGSGSTLDCNSVGGQEETLACAAAEGLRGNDGPVNQILKHSAGDGYQPNRGGYTSLYASYMLYVVTADRMAKQGYASFYPDAGGSGPPPPDGGAKKDTGQKLDSGGASGDSGGNGATAGTGGCAVARQRSAGRAGLVWGLLLLGLARILRQSSLLRWAIPSASRRRSSSTHGRECDFVVSPGLASVSPTSRRPADAICGLAIRRFKSGS